MLKNISEAALVELWRKGDDAAFDEIYKRYLIPLVNMARLKTGDQETARELVQDVFMALHLNKQNLNVHTTLQTYLFTALKNAVYNHKRKQLNREKHLQYMAGNNEQGEDNIVENIDAGSLKKIIDHQIALLPHQCKTVFMMSREENLSHKQIAERLDISVNTIEQHIRKARRILRHAIKDYTLLAVVIFYHLKK